MPAGGREESCALLSSGHEMVIAPMNSPQLWLSAPDLHKVKSTRSVNIPAGSANWSQWVVNKTGCGGGGHVLWGAYDEETLFTCINLSRHK